MVCTRDVPVQSESGRERTMVFIRRSLSAHGEVAFLRLHSILERRSAARFASMVFAFIVGLASWRPLPLQTLLFQDRRAARELEAAIRQHAFDTVYFDGVRSGHLAIAIRKRFPDLRLVCDFDDLMSRRMAMLADSRQPISMGYLKKLVPAWVQHHVLDGMLARAIQAYEWRSLRNLERRIAAVCDEVVLVSSVDAAHAHIDMPEAPLAVIPPYMPAPVSPALAPRVERFVFIGSDSLLQNRQAIEFLVGLWTRVAPGTPLHIFGKQTGSYPVVSGVVFRGFVPDVEAAYESGSVLLAPSFLSGGVKTKVLEAMSFGVVPLGTEITFEGIAADCRSLVGTLDQIAAWVEDPMRWWPKWQRDGAMVIAQVAKSHSADLLGRRWCDVVWPPA